MARPATDTGQMAGTATPRTQRFKIARGGLRSVASHRWMLIGSASVTLVAGVVSGSWWMLTQRTYWAGQFSCSAGIGISGPARHLFSAAGVILALAVIVALFLIARGSARIRKSHLVIYWSASFVLWAVLASMAATDVFVNACLRVLFL